MLYDKQLRATECHMLAKHILWSPLLHGLWWRARAHIGAHRLYSVLPSYLARHSDLYVTIQSKLATIIIYYRFTWTILPVFIVLLNYSRALGNFLRLFFFSFNFTLHTLWLIDQFSAVSLFINKAKPRAANKRSRLSVVSHLYTRKWASINFNDQ